MTGFWPPVPCHAMRTPRTCSVAGVLSSRRDFITGQTIAVDGGTVNT
ncbi:MAG: hypothetical protein ACE368_22170 [Paracoccaceae bacterium]